MSLNEQRFETRVTRFDAWRHFATWIKDSVKISRGGNSTALLALTPRVPLRNTLENPLNFPARKRINELAVTRLRNFDPVRARGEATYRVYQLLLRNCVRYCSQGSVHPINVVPETITSSVVGNVQTRRDIFVLRSFHK